MLRMELGGTLHSPEAVKLECSLGEKNVQQKTCKNTYDLRMVIKAQDRSRSMNQSIT